MAHLEILPAMLGISVLEIPCYTSDLYPKNGFRYGYGYGHGRSQVNGELGSILIEQKKYRLKRLLSPPVEPHRRVPVPAIASGDAGESET